MRILLDDNGFIVPLANLSAPQILAVSAAGGAAVLSAAIASKAARLHSTVDVFILPTVAGAVTPATGHFHSGGGACYDIPLGPVNTKISVIAVGAVAGTTYLSELG